MSVADRVRLILSVDGLAVVLGSGAPLQHHPLTNMCGEPCLLGPARCFRPQGIWEAICLKDLQRNTRIRRCMYYIDNPSIHPSIHPSTDRPTNRPTDRPTYPPTGIPTYLPTYRPTDLYTYFIYLHTTYLSYQSTYPIYPTESYPILSYIILYLNAKYVLFFFRLWGSFESFEFRSLALTYAC